MQIKLSFDDVDVISWRQRDKRRLPLAFPIAIEHSGRFYPSEDWQDFGIVLLGWWSWQVLSLLKGSRVKRLLFMKGPYEIQTRYRRSTGVMELRPSGLDEVWAIQPDELITVLINALQTALRELGKLHIGISDQEMLISRLDDLHHAALLLSESG